MNSASAALRLGIRTACMALVIGLFPGRISATVHLFRIDPTATSLTLQGNTSGSPWQEQNPGGLTTSFQGWLVVDLQSSSLQLLSGSRLLAAETNSCQPGVDGSTTAAPADYGALATSGHGITTVNELTAVRNLAFDLASPPLSTDAGPIDTSSMTLTIPSSLNSSLDYRENGLLVLTGSRALDSLNATNAGTGATFSFALEEQVLSIPINVSFTSQVLTPGDTTLRFTGVVVATRGLSILNRQLLLISSPTNPPDFTLIWDTSSPLQMSPTLNPPNWTNFATNAPVTILPTDPSAFFRVGEP